jgi:hypothetical protein
VPGEVRVTRRPYHISQDKGHLILWSYRNGGTSETISHRSVDYAVSH